MFDEYRSVARDLQDTARQTTFPTLDVNLPPGVVALVQGLIVGFNCRNVIDTNFGIGLTAAAVCTAFRRLPSSAEARFSYVAVGDVPDTARYMYTFLKRRYTAWAPHVQIRLGTVKDAFKSLPAGSVDLGIVHGQDSWAATLRDVRDVTRVLRPGGLVLVSPSSRPAPDAAWEEWCEQAGALRWESGGPCFLAQVRHP